MKLLIGKIRNRKSPQITTLKVVDINLSVQPFHSPLLFPCLTHFQPSSISPWPSFHPLEIMPLTLSQSKTFISPHFSPSSLLNPTLHFMPFTPSRSCPSPLYKLTFALPPYHIPSTPLLNPHVSACTLHPCFTPSQDKPLHLVTSLIHPIYFTPNFLHPIFFGG